MARAGDTPSSALRRKSESTLACLAFRAILRRTGEPNTSVASPSALMARSSGPRRNSASWSAALLRSTVICPTTCQGVGSSSPGPVPVTVAAPARRRPPIPAAASPSSAPVNSTAGQLGPASTATWSGVPSGPGFSEASLKTTGASLGPVKRLIRWAGPSREGAVASISTPAISDVAPLASPTIRSRPSCTISRSNPIEWRRAGGSTGNRNAPSAPRAIVSTGFSRRMSENRIWPLASLISASSRRAEANDNLGPFAPGADNAPSPNARYGVGRRRTSIGPVRETLAPVIERSCASISARWADQSTRSGVTSAADITATSATAMMVRTWRTEQRFPLSLDELPRNDTATIRG